MNLNDDLVQQAKQRAAAENRTLTSVIEDALRRLLSSSSALVQSEPYRVRPVVRRDLQPGLDPNDPAFYQQICEQDDIEKYRPQGRTFSSGPDAPL